MPDQTVDTFDEKSAIEALLRLGYQVGVNGKEGEPNWISVVVRGRERTFVEGFDNKSIPTVANASRELIDLRRRICG